MFFFFLSNIWSHIARSNTELSAAKKTKADIVQPNVFCVACMILETL